MFYGTLCGLTLDRKYRLGQYLGESDGTASFSTLLSDGRAAVGRIIAADSQAAQGLHRSWMLATGLTHPNLVRIHDAGDAELDGVPGFYAITEQPEDCLSEITASRPLTSEEAREVLRSIVPCIEYLHRNGVAHGAVQASSIVAIGDSVKLMADTLGPADGQGKGGLFGGSKTRDVEGIGFLTVEMLTGRRPANRTQAEQAIANTDLPAPFHEIALGCIREERFGRWTLQQVASALEPSKTAPVSEPDAVSEASRPPHIRAGLIAAIAGVLLMLLFVGYRMFLGGPAAASRSRIPAPEDTVVFPPPASTTPAPVVQKPSAMPVPNRPATASRTEAARSSAATTRNAADWAVVAAIYRNYDAAENRARSLASKWHHGELQVYPTKGNGSQYMVVVASGLAKAQAEKIQQQAKAAGLPRDTYVTKLR
jgi:hypothetical protein